MRASLDGGGRRDPGGRPGHRDPHRGIWTGSSSASTGSIGPAAGTGAGPVSGCRSCATSWTTTAGPASISSVEGQGTTVVAAPPGDADRRGATPMAEATVLVVEDEESFVDALMVSLRREGFLVHVARDGAEALQQFDEVAPRPGAARRHAARAQRRRRVPRDPEDARRCRSSWSPRSPRRSTRSSASRWVPTTTSPSRTASASWSPGCGRPSAASRTTSGAPAGGRGCARVGDVALDPDRHEVDHPGRDGGDAAQGVRAADACCWRTPAGCSPATR